MKRGYTLVEMLAVIVILSILFYIAYGGVSEYLRYSNDKSFDTYGRNLIAIGEEYANETEDYDACLTINFLVTQNYIKDYVTEETIKYLKHYSNKEDSVCDGYIVITNAGDELVVTPYLSCGKYEDSDITVDKESEGYSESDRSDPLICTQ